MVGERVERLRGLGADLGAGLEMKSVAGTAAESLPAVHLELLRSLNGLTVYHGAFRLLGVGRAEPALDLVAWNARETWRFAWDDRVDPYLIFGETAWGDQYAYRQGASGVLDQEIYFLEGTLLRPEVLAESF